MLNGNIWFSHWIRTKLRLIYILHHTSMWANKSPCTLPGSSGCIVYTTHQQLAAINAVGRFEHFKKWFLSIDSPKKVVIKTLPCTQIFNCLGGGLSIGRRSQNPLSSGGNIDIFIITMSHHEFRSPCIQTRGQTNYLVDWCFYAIFWDIMIRWVCRYFCVVFYLRGHHFGDYIWIHIFVQIFKFI